MAMHEVDEFDFSDDDLDALPENALQELEASAIRLTQHPPASIAKATATRHVPPPVDDLGFDEEDVIDLEQNGAPFQQASDSTRNRSNAAPRHLTISHAQPHSLPYAPARQAESHADANATQSDAMKSFAELQAKLQELEQENAALKNTTTSLGGEVSIVRSKHDKSVKEYERKLAVMQQLHTDEIAKQKAELETARKDRETAETNNRFLEHDLAQEIGRAKVARKTLKDGQANKTLSTTTSPAVTPKKSKFRAFGDGFDDDDVLMVSPSKSQTRSKASTPRHGAKRKRSVVYSPTLPLLVTQPKGLLQPQESIDSILATEMDPEMMSKLGKEDYRFDFLQRVLNYMPLGNSERFFETLSKVQYPSTPTRTLASLVFERISVLPNSNSRNEFPQAFFRLLMDIWAQCIKEEYYAPVNVLVDTLQHLLTYEPQKTATLLTDTLIPLAVSTVDIVAVPIAKASTIAPKMRAIKDTAAPKEPEAPPTIDVNACLGLLYDLALSCTSTSSDAVNIYWDNIQHDFILLLLMKVQPISQILLTLQIVATSALPSRFGASLSTDNPEQRVKRETALLDRLTNLLFETPDLESHTGPSASRALWELRIETLTTLGSIALTSRGGSSMARHRLVIGRLIRFLNDAIDHLYNFLYSSHTETVCAVNLCTRLIHHLIKSHADLVDVRTKLSAVQGGAHKHLVALTRLAFSDTLVLEQGIDDEVIDMAHQLLDEFLSPEEGEALLQVFSSGKSMA